MKCLSPPKNKCGLYIVCSLQEYDFVLFFSVRIKVDDVPIRLQICDTAGQVMIIVKVLSTNIKRATATKT